MKTNPKSALCAFTSGLLALAVGTQETEAELLAYYDFNEGSGVVAQSQGSLSADAELVGSTKPGWVAGVGACGTAVEFYRLPDQTFYPIYMDSIVIVPENPGFVGLPQMTLGMWIKPTVAMRQGDVPWSMGKEPFPSGKGTNLQAWGNLGVADGINFYHNPDEISRFPSASIPLPAVNEWHHLGVTFDGLKVRTYFDGELKETMDAAGVINTARGWMSIGGLTTDGLTHNSYLGYFNNGFAGMIDEVKVYDSVEDMATVMALPTCDSDHDGLLDDVETNTGFYVDENDTGTDPTLADTDGDGLDDGIEVTIGTDPNNADSDGDTLSDGDEIDNGTNPLNADSDGDCVGDALDPTPNTQGVPADYIDGMLLDLSNAILELPLSSFDAKNDKAAAGKRNALANKVLAAANMWAEGDIDGTYDKLDGDVTKKTGDWVLEPDSSSIQAEVDCLLGLIGFF